MKSIRDLAKVDYDIHGMNLQYLNNILKNFSHEYLMWQ